MRKIFIPGMLAAVIAIHAASESPRVGQTAASTPDKTAIVFVLAPVVRTGPPDLRFPRGSQIARLTQGTRPSSARILSGGFFAAADPQIAFDGKQIVFAGEQNRGDIWQIWTMPADGGEARQITRCDLNCVQPVLLADGLIAYTVVSREDRRRASEVYVCNAQGKDAHAITFGPGDYETEAALRGGRLLLSARWPLTPGEAARAGRTLYTIRPDGSELTALRDTSAQGDVLTDATELPDGTIVFLQSTAEGPNKTIEHLAWLRPGALRASETASTAAAYQSVAAMPGDRLLISRRSVSSRNGEFNLYESGFGREQPDSLLFAKPHFSIVQAVAVVPREVPQRYWSILHPTAQTGRVVCLNAYLSQDFAGGRIEAALAAVRVLALDGNNHEFLLGKVPVEGDGSFYISVPANLPIRFQLLDAQGKILREQRGWIWVRNGEDRGCLGCHESHRLAPANRSPLALQRLDTPFSLTGRTPSHAPSSGVENP